MRNFFRKLKNSFRKRLSKILNFSIKDPWIELNLLLGRDVIIQGIKLPYRKIPKASILELKRGTYEDVERDFIKKYLPRGVYVIELGASIGVISCYILEKKPVRLISFEAVKKWAELARETVNLNYKEPIPFEVVQLAIGAVGQSQVIFNSHSDSNLGGQISSTQTDISIMVPAISLFDLNKIYNVPMGAWLIMDIEGMEWDITKNQGAALNRYRGVIVECHNTMDGDRLITPNEIVAGFIKNGFKLIEEADHGTHIVAVFEAAS
jgi:FkbM family methyltransferase